MGGRPCHVVISLGLPPYVAVEFVLDLYAGMKEICHQYGVNIIGGDTVASPGALVINVAVVGDVYPSGLLRRSGATPGELVVVTGVLGNSAAGLDLLLKGDWEQLEYAQPLVAAHLTPRPQLVIGQQLAGWGATSADDISDGLASEANELAQASQVCLHIKEVQIPLSPEMKQAAAAWGKSPYDYALFGGEDYQLIFTIPPQLLTTLPSTPGMFTTIGEVTAGSGVVLVTAAGPASLLTPQGYNHFR
jgi:thiamine-monophosphate kinase